MVRRYIDDVCVIRHVGAVFLYSNSEVGVGPALAVPVHRIGEPLQELLVLLEQLLILVDAMEDALFVPVALGEVLGSLGLQGTVVELEDVLVLRFELLLEFQVDHFRVVDADRPGPGLLSHNLIDEIHSFRGQLNERQYFLLADLRTQHQPLRQRTQARIARNEVVGRAARHLGGHVDV